MNRLERVQNLFKTRTIRVVRNAHLQTATNDTVLYRSLHAYNKGWNKVTKGINNVI